MHNLKNCSFTQKGENHLNLSCCILDAAKQNNAWKNAFFSGTYCIVVYQNCPQNGFKRLILQITENYFFSFSIFENSSEARFLPQKWVIFKTLWTPKSNELDPWTVFGKRQKLFYDLLKRHFFPVGGQKFIWRFEVKEAQKVAQLVPSCPSLKSKPIMNHKSYTTLYN